MEKRKKEKENIWKKGKEKYETHRKERNIKSKMKGK